MVEAVLCPSRNAGFLQKVEAATPLGRVGKYERVHRMQPQQQAELSEAAVIASYLVLQI
mgnify:FL=1